MQIKWSGPMTPEQWPEIVGLIDVDNTVLAQEIQKRWNSFEALLAACLYYRDEAISSYPEEFVNSTRARELERLMDIALRAAGRP